LGGVYQDGIIEVLRKGGQFGDTFFEGRGDEYLKRGAERGEHKVDLLRMQRRKEGKKRGGFLNAWHGAGKD
jgi:hypothetical protein